MLGRIKIYLLFIVAFGLHTANGQPPKTVKPNQHTSQKFKPPKLYTTLGIRSDTVAVVVEEAIQLIRIPLKITDDKKNLYTISSYQFLYKRRTVSEDEKTGKAVPASSIVSDLFRSTPLPDLWKNLLTEQIKPGEELFFFDIIVTDASGRFMFAPNLKLLVK